MEWGSLLTRGALWGKSHIPTDVAKSMGPTAWGGAGDGESRLVRLGFSLGAKAAGPIDRMACRSRGSSGLGYFPCCLDTLVTGSFKSHPLRPLTPVRE